MQNDKKMPMTRIQERAPENKWMRNTNAQPGPVGQHGVIDAMMNAEGPHPVGFDLAEGPFGEIHVEDAVYRHGYEEFKLADFCDGWIYTKPISEYEGVTPVSGWVNENNLARARAQSPSPRFRQAAVEDFNEGIARDAEIHRRWGRLR